MSKQSLSLVRKQSLLSLLVGVLLCIAPSRQLQQSFWWGDANGTDFLILQRNQNSPRGCVASFAFSTTSALSDRIKIMRKAQWPDAVLSPQVLLSCSQNNNGCKGGSPMAAYEWIKRNNITDVTCSPYQALDSETGLKCTSNLKCLNCMYDRFAPEQQQCTPQLRAKVYGIDSFGTVEGEQAIMDEVRRNGPVTCTINITQGFLDYQKGILKDSGGPGMANHHISITGWGVEGGVRYWRGRNSWGSHWGEGGDFRMIRGVNFLNIEGNCSWAIPLDTWTKDIRNETKPKEMKEAYNSKLTQQQNSQGSGKSQGSSRKCKRESTKLIPEHVISPRPHEYLTNEDLPESWDWRNVSGVNYLSWTKNQRVPHYCGACWIEAATSVVADRINIARKRAWPDITIAPQVIINCKYGGSCDGGNPGHIYMYGKQVGLPEESCQAYTAKNPAEFLCSNEQICHKCSSSGCAPVKRYAVWKVLEHGLVEGAQRMKAEIYARGPISCGIDATNRWEDYTGGIYSESKLILDENHEISVVGWGKENGIEYWIGRNSYGTHWGESGFFRISMHRNNLGIELECSWPAVDKEPHIIELDGSQGSFPEDYIVSIQ